ncbi:MAG: hypothetical protein QME81_12620 [bacterium]|nr:hypothetical protein [bacterium]
MTKNITLFILLLTLVRPTISQAKEHPARRAEIVFTVSLPLTFLNSLIIVGGIEWLREGSSVRLEEKDWWTIGAGALTFSSLVAYYDLKKQSFHPIEEQRPSSTVNRMISPFQVNGLIAQDIYPEQDICNCSISCGK